MSDHCNMTLATDGERCFIEVNHGLSNTALPLQPLKLGADQPLEKPDAANRASKRHRTSPPRLGQPLFNLAT